MVCSLLALLRRRAGLAAGTHRTEGTLMARKRKCWPGFTEEDMALLDRGSDLREAREAAERAIRSGDIEAMKTALQRLEKANEAARRRNDG